jgi:hypothetical protein
MERIVPLHRSAMSARDHLGASMDIVSECIIDRAAASYRASIWMAASRQTGQLGLERSLA